ncbi:MAG TPA: Lrp/AsnC ligand binding domain-containing protein [Chitinophagales bacterium]|jgi:Lrp/AsnC family transcriptional regulator for asnA, asnC and gidA|nr:Lrp/AsnC ligand binding domain-containing protein [Chitinophagales bacterium]
MSENYEIDKVDIQILHLLMQDAMMPFTEIAQKIGVSPGTIHVRMKKMDAMGLIKSSHLIVNPQKLGYGITAYLGVYLDKSSMYDKVVKELENIDEIVECHYMTGTYSMFIKIICKDTTHLKKILHDQIQPIVGIDRTETFISLEESFSRPMKIEMKGKGSNGV